MVKNTLTLLGALCYSYALIAQSTLSGLVTEANGVTPVADVHVMVLDEKRGALTSGDGTFEIRDISAGVHIVQFSSVGYETRTDTISAGGKDQELLVSMHEVIFTLPGATIDGGSMTGGLRHLQDVPGSAYYLGPAELDKFAYTDVHRILGIVPGLHMQEEDGYGLRPNIGIRGSGAERSSKVTIMEDGVLAAPAPYAAPSAYYFPTAGRMHGVEILKGSSQIKYGPNTTGGAVNFISTPIPGSFRGSIRLLGGTYDSHNVHATIGNAHRNVAYLAEVFDYGTDGFKKLSGQNTGFDKKDYLIKFRLNTNPGAPVYQALTFKAGRMKELSYETYLGLTEEDFLHDPLQRYPGSQRDEMDAHQEQYTMKHSLILPSGITLQTTAYRQDFSRNWYKLDKVVAGGTASGISDILKDSHSALRHLALIRGAATVENEELQVKANNRAYRSEGIQSTLRFTVPGDRWEHHFEAGIRLHRDEMDRYQWVDSYGMQDAVLYLVQRGVPGTESNRIESARARAIHLQYHAKLGALSFFPGLRNEHVRLTRKDYGKNDPQRTGGDLNERENLVDAWLPGVGIGYDLSPKHSLFAGVHTGFAPPGSNAGAKPERSINYELGWRHHKGSLSIETVLFYSDYHNLLGADIAAAGGSGSTDTYNGGAAETGGIEVLASCDIASGDRWHLPLELSYTYTYGRFRNAFESTFEGWGNVENGNPIPYIAPHRLSVQTGISHQRYAVNVSMRYTDAMPVSADSDQLPLYTDSYFVIDIASTFRINTGLEVFATVRNLIDGSYIVARRPAGVRPGLPRSVEFGLSASF